jgi:hypothetical protein
MVQGPNRVELELRRRRCKRDFAPPRAKTVAPLGASERAYSGTTSGDAFGWRELSLHVHLTLGCATPGQLRPPIHVRTQLQTHRATTISSGR